ncbi:uncharacterized protein LOC119970645 isoform X2 [Scyliorhinus canicula]|uniref:uncharacterized protein LOC119970645 isoform X2 n=1 Tax=Scyliorhinus canicula TaxID=7830 RepID=UPI0018F2D361|nr:uncharacterized protein LOC119970645 isoform X2 [Scyliorhinus canicula]
MMAPTPRSNKFQEVDGTPCHGVKMQSQNLFRRVNIETPGEKSRTAFIPRQRLVTPLISNTLNHLISNVENNQRKSEKPVSPNLEMLRMTPGLQQKQRLLQEKHLKAKSLVDKIPVGGPLLLHLNYYSGRVRTFHGYHPITSNSEVALNQSLIRWHKDFRKLLGNVQRQFEAPFHCVHVTFILYIMLYIVGITMLLYYLVDNMIQKSRLTPKRIKIWLTLLVVTATWTFLMIKLLVAAHHLERAIEGTVYTLIEELADLAVTGHDLRCYHDIVTYWQFRCLPPTTHGILNIFGLIKVRDISFYFHYYSLPVITALCTPVIKLLLALKTIYSRPHVY